MTRSYRLFTFALILMLLVLTLFLDKISQIDFTRHKLDPNKPEYTFHDFTATNFDLQGKIQERINAQLMWQFPQSDQSRFLKPIMYVYKDGILQYHVVADSGQYDKQKKQGYFDKKVSIYIPADKKNPASQINTSKMLIDTESQLASSEQPVQFEFGASHGSAVGFKYDRKNQQLYLLSQVRVTYVKPK